MSDIENRVAEVEDGHKELSKGLTALANQVNDTLGKILAALESSADGKSIGLQESMRTMSVTVQSLTKNVASLMEVVATHERDRQRVKGAWWAACLIGAAAGGIVSKLVTKFWP